MIVFDSYAWLEYFSGSNKGKEVQRIICSKEEIATPSICLAEVKKKYLKEDKEYETRIKFILSRSKIINLNTEITLLAAELSYKYKLYLIDAMIYSCAKIINSVLLTGDKHFENLENIKIL